MPTDSWGIVDGYEDVNERWHDTPSATRQAILAAMGVGDANAVPPGASTFVLRAGTEHPAPCPGRLQTEDGQEITVASTLPGDLPPGYHTLVGRDGRRFRLIVTPGRCPLPSPAYGWSAQLYAARSRESWGIGDLGDLARLGSWAQNLDAGFLLLNPIVGGTPLESQESSPYFPCSRRFLNPLYVRVDAAAGAELLTADERRQLAREGEDLNRASHIDRRGAFRIKDKALRLIWSRFGGDKGFDSFCRRRGEELEQFAVWCALAGRHGEGDWRRWPAEHRRPENAAVARFAKENAGEVRYQQWLQWQTERQLAAAAEKIALVQDLPIGVDPGGADAWAWQDLLATDCSVGAPPDLFNPDGQDWALPPFVPHKLQAAGYEPFIQTIRASLRHGKGLRIDHVMGLFRLYWIPHGFGPQRGTYVRYPADDLLGIVALESSRAGAFVVGEDLGTVEPAVRDDLREHQILSFRLLWFEKKPPAAYPQLAMAAATTHDLATVAGLWTGADWQEQQALGVGSEESMRNLREHLGKLIDVSPAASTAQAIEAAYGRLAEAPSLLLAATLEDALAVEVRPNVPGTTGERRPNWSIPLPGGIEALEAAELPRRIAAALERSPTAGEGRRPVPTSVPDPNEP